MTKRATLAFTTGVAAKPSDYYRMVKLWDVDANGIEDTLYQYMPESEFDELALDASYYWTEDYVIADSARELLIRPNDTATLQIRYVSTNTTMSDDSTDSGLTSRWDEAVSLWTCYRLLNIDGSNEEAQMMRDEAIEMIKSTVMAKRFPGGFKSGRRLKSYYENKDYLNIR
jgi:hypothetical protein